MFAFCSPLENGRQCRMSCQNTETGETTGFQSPTQDHIEHVVDLARILNLGHAGIHPVRVSGQAFQERGIRDGDILIANTAADPAHGKVAVAVLQGSFRLATSSTCPPSSGTAGRGRRDC
jgi:hypothetical protein